MNSNETHHAHDQAEKEVCCSSCGIAVERQEALLLGITDVAEELVELWVCEACLEEEGVAAWMSS